MRSIAQTSSLAIWLTLAHMAAAAEPAFTLRLEGVNLDYPGGEQWAEIECPDGTRDWSFAIYEGAGNWTVPLRAEAAGKYRIVRVERRAGGRTTEVVIAKDSQITIEQQSSRRISKPSAPGKPLVEAGEFTTFFAAEEPWCVNDHTFVQGPDRIWHLFGITHPKPLVWEKDPGRQLCHATAATLRQTPWEALEFAVRRDLEKHREFLLWAPHVIRHEGTYYLFVCVGDPGDHARYRIHLLTSKDLREWTRSPDNPMVVDGFDARDPFVTRVGGQWVLYYTANSTPPGGNHQVVCVTSDDLRHWGNRRVVFTHPRAGSFGGPTESPFVVQRGGSFYLFVCDNEWTEVYQSNDPFHWEFEQKNTRILAHAAEIVRDTDGKWFISHAGWMGGPLRLAPLTWKDGLDREPTNILPAESPGSSLQWQQLPPLPNVHGFGWPFAGVLADQLLVAGGANFPDRPLWEGGAKKWHDDVFLLAQPDGEWKRAGKLPRPLGYGVSITTRQGVICIGGSDADRHYREVFRLERDGGGIRAWPLPALPRPLANGAGALLGQTIYVAGGIETPTATNALRNFWALDLSSPSPSWRELEPWPGPARMLGVSAAVGDAFYLVSGTELGGNATGRPLRRYLNDAYQFKPGVGWKRLTDLPRPTVAAASPAPTLDGSQFLVISGDDGTRVDFKPLQNHPGFPRDILGYDVRQNSWSTLGEFPGPAPVTVPVVHWRDQFVLPNGEIRPAVRTPEVWSLRVK